MKLRNSSLDITFLYNIEAKDDAAIKEFDRVSRIDENVVRHLVINLDK
ncbi:MAG: hypothetical protein ACLUG3_02410 [Bacilli bacterium]